MNASDIIKAFKIHEHNESVLQKALDNYDWLGLDLHNVNDFAFILNTLIECGLLDPYQSRSGEFDNCFIYRHPIRCAADIMQKYVVYSCDKFFLCCDSTDGLLSGERVEIAMFFNGHIIWDTESIDVSSVGCITCKSMSLDVSKLLTSIRLVGDSPRLHVLKDCDIYASNPITVDGNATIFSNTGCDLYLHCNSDYTIPKFISMDNTSCIIYRDYV